MRASGENELQVLPERADVLTLNDCAVRVTRRAELAEYHRIQKEQLEAQAAEAAELATETAAQEKEDEGAMALSDEEEDERALLNHDLMATTRKSGSRFFKESKGNAM